MIMRWFYFLSILMLVNCALEPQQRYKPIKTTDNVLEGDSVAASTGSGSGTTAGDGETDASGTEETGAGGSSGADTSDAGTTGNDLEIVGNPNSTLTFDDVQELFITDPAGTFEGCTASGCHGADPADRGPMATTDFSSYDAIKDAEDGTAGIIVLYLTKGNMPKGGLYAQADIQRIADWIAAGMAPGEVAAPPGGDANAVVTATVAALFGAGKGNCTSAGCHNGTVNPNLLGNANLKQNIQTALIRLDAYAAGNADPMPVPGQGTDLLAAELDMIRAWIAAGRPD